MERDAVEQARKEQTDRSNTVASGRRVCWSVLGGDRHRPNRPESAAERRPFWNSVRQQELARNSWQQQVVAQEGPAAILVTKAEKEAQQLRGRKRREKTCSAFVLDKMARKTEMSQLRAASLGSNAVSGCSRLRWRSVSISRPLNNNTNGR
jgi:hypothetical protein